MTRVQCFRAVLLSALAGLTTACGSAERTAWQEEVKLSDGRLLRVEREVTWTTTHPLGEGKSYGVGGTTLRPAKDASQPALPEWNGREEATLLLDVDPASGSFMLVTYPESCERYAAGSRPDPPYFVYRVRGDRWEPVPFDAALVGRATNLYPRPRVGGERGLIDVEYKKQIIRKLRPQTRELVAHGRRSNC
jgi:hypothetical protein